MQPKSPLRIWQQHTRVGKINRYRETDLRVNPSTIVALFKEASVAESRCARPANDAAASIWRSRYGRLGFAVRTCLGANDGRSAGTGRFQHAADHDGFPAEGADDPAADEPTLA